MSDDHRGSQLVIDKLVKTFTGSGRERGARVTAVKDVSLTVEPGQLFTLLGPSGCGKTTTLRAVAGLERPDSGEILLSGRPLYSSQLKVWVPPHERGLGMVYQSYAIWPHMTVFENIAFPLRALPRRRRPSRSDLRARVERVLDVVQLGHLVSRPATNLSGGQQQRLALARAVILEPPLLLLDEPLSNLDAKLREEMRFELKRLQRELGITSIYVTHDQVEALSLSDVVAVMREGEIDQIGSPREIYENPSSRFTAAFIGTSNFIKGHIAAREGRTYKVETSDGVLSVPSYVDVPNGSEVTVSVRPEHISIQASSDNGPSATTWKGTIEGRAFLGEAIDYVVRTGDHALRVRSHPSVMLDMRSTVLVTVDSDYCSLISSDH